MIYHFDSTFHLFRRLDGGNFSYSDGAEAETRLLTVVTNANDRSTFSPELAASITDWVSEYHLSKSRHCLLRPLGIQAGNKVLELGCGCGAITRFLGEIGADVVAVEGSLARAHIAAERCRDLANVRIIVDDLLRFETEERFDFILLIGVLEYAAVFSDYTNPFEHYLRAVAHLLAPDGKLVVAIENKLGLKYFNGCGEDHVGTPFFGVQDLYQSKTVRTFGRRDLIAQLCGAGLSHVQFYYPFPDYKLPSVILSEAALSDKRFDAIDLLARCHARDYTGYPFRSFDEALAVLALHNNDLLAELSNSFLVTATTRQDITNAPAELATSFSVHRAAEFCTQTKFVLIGDGIQVQKEYLTVAPQQPIVLSDGLTIRHHLDDSTYRPGRQLLWGLLKTRARTGDLQSIVEALRPWMGFLLQHARVPAAQIAGLGEKPADLALYRLPATFVDCTPFNVLETNNGLFAIDLEWTSDSEISLGWVVARGVLHSLLAGVPSADSLNSNAEIATALCSAFGLSVSEQELGAWMEREAHFQTAVMGAETTRPTIRMTSGGLRTWLSEITRLNQVVGERDDLLTSVYNTLGARDKQVAEVYQALASRDEELASLRHTIRAQEQETVRIGEQLQHAQEEIGLAQKEIGLAQKEIGRAQKEIGRAQEEIGRRTEEVVRTREELGRAQEELAGLLKQLSIVRTQLGAIEASTSWKMTKVFRDALSSYPGVRRAIKRTSHIVYWTATLQLPQRLKARRRLLKDRDQIAASPLFDAAWYLREYFDVASAGLDPALHYLLFGAAERRNPGPSFDAAWYLEHNADVAKSDSNPLLHYLKVGSVEKREIRNVKFLAPNQDARPQDTTAPLSAPWSYERESAAKKWNTEFVHRATDSVNIESLQIKALAFYLPQFHPIPENDLWWGKNFTEWTNVTRAVPQFPGHFQPQLPGDLGFYDLRVPEVMKEQIELAKQYGISGFCFHYYWFAGKRLLEKPLEQFLADPSLNIGFCLCWANENWTRRWDGLESDVLIAQQYSPDDDRAFLESLFSSFRDSRYIRIDNKPMLLVYRIDLLPNPRDTVDRWREMARENGFSDLYVVAVRSFDVRNVEMYGVDAAVEFPPHQASAVDITNSITEISNGFSGRIYDYAEMAARYGKQTWSDIRTFKTVVPSWDNTARRGAAAHVFWGSTPLLYAEWLKDACDSVMTYPKGERLVFINAWNEWAEGAHLEPDARYGYAYLQTTANILRYYCTTSEDTAALITANNQHFKKTSDIAIVLHCYHEEVVYEIVERYLRQYSADVDVFATLRPDASGACVHYLQERLSSVLLIPEENRGRDIRPFLRVLGRLKELGYVAACKIHTKRSPHRQDGSQWRDVLIASLLGGEHVIDVVRDRFHADTHLGLLVPQGSLVDLSVEEINKGNRVWLDRLLREIGRDDLIGSYKTLFPAGSMYWFRLTALAELDYLVLKEDAFELEAGQLDGTLAHAIERIVLLCASAAGYSTEEIDVSQIQGNLQVQSTRGS